MSFKYNRLIERNLGLITKEEQKILKKSCIAIFGVGGLGGVISEVLTRSGIGYLKIIDNDKFEITNLNRQNFSFQNTIGKLKINVIEKFLKKINPQIKIEKYKEVTESNINRILKNVNVAVLAIDSLKPCLIISRATKKKNIPLVEGWAIPFGNVRVFTKDTPSLEEVYQLPTTGKKISSFSDEDFRRLTLYMLEKLKKIKGIESFYPPYAIEKIKKGKIPSFAPLVWLTAVLMSLEVIKLLLKWGKIPFSPYFALYNPFNHSIPEQEV